MSVYRIYRASFLLASQSSIVGLLATRDLGAAAWSFPAVLSGGIPITLDARRSVSTVYGTRPVCAGPTYERQLLALIAKSYREGGRFCRSQAL